MHLDWYDRRIVSFMLESGDARAEPSDEASRASFGISGRRVMRRFTAVLDAMASQRYPLDEPDRGLVARATRALAGH